MFRSKRFLSSLALVAAVGCGAEAEEGAADPVTFTALPAFTFVTLDQSTPSFNLVPPAYVNWVYVIAKPSFAHYWDFDFAGGFRLYAEPAAPPTSKSACEATKLVYSFKTTDGIVVREGTITGTWVPAGTGPISDPAHCAVSAPSPAITPPPEGADADWYVLTANATVFGVEQPIRLRSEVIIGAAAARPDLTVKVDVRDPSGNPVSPCRSSGVDKRLTFSVINLSDSFVRPSKLYVQAYSETYGDLDVAAFTGKGTRSFTMNYQAPFGDYVRVVRADSTNLIAEVTESNNKSQWECVIIE